MKARARFRLTYQVVTEESAFHGDFERCGFVPENFRVPAKGNNLPGAIPLFSLREAIRFLLDRESQSRVEADSCPVSLSNPPRWFSCGGTVDWQSGESLTISLHLPSCISPYSAIRIARLLRCYGLKPSTP